MWNRNLRGIPRNLLRLRTEIDHRAFPRYSRSNQRRPARHKQAQRDWQATNKRLNVLFYLSFDDEATQAGLRHSRLSATGDDGRERDLQGQCAVTAQRIDSAVFPSRYFSRFSCHRVIGERLDRWREPLFQSLPLGTPAGVSALVGCLCSVALACFSRPARSLPYRDAPWGGGTRRSLRQVG